MSPSLRLTHISPLAGKAQTPIPESVLPDFRLSMDLGLIGYDAVSENVQLVSITKALRTSARKRSVPLNPSIRATRCSVSGHCSERNGRQEIKKIYRRDYPEAAAPDPRFYCGWPFTESGAADCHIGAIVILNCQRLLSSNANF